MNNPRQRRFTTSLGRLLFLVVIAGCNTSRSDPQLVSIQGEGFQFEVTFKQFVDSHAIPSVSVELTIENKSHDPLLFLPWGTPWEGFLSRDVFTLIVDGAKAEYTGPIIKRRAPEIADYVEVAPKGKLASIIHMDEYYNLGLSGSVELTYSQNSIWVYYKNQNYQVTMPDMAAPNLRLQ